VRGGACLLEDERVGARAGDLARQPLDMLRASGASGRAYGKAVAVGIAACASLSCGSARTGTL
jgi:hypothetical protein